MFVDYYYELSEFRNVDEARNRFIDACESLWMNGGTWRNVFEQWWLHFVTARISAQAFDKMNENFFRTTFTSCCLDVLTMYYSFETEYNTAEDRCDFLAILKSGFAKHAILIKFKYFTKKEVEKTDGGRGAEILGGAKPNEETARRARDYLKAVTAKSDWGCRAA